MKINRTCKICGKSFSAIKVTQFFCCRKCFKRDYYLRTKASIQEQQQHPNYPIKRCSYCEIQSRLNFDPVKNPDKFDAWQCPHCGTTNGLIWKYQDTPNSHQIIGNILISFKTILTREPAPQPQVYRIPIAKPGYCNPSIVVMTCDELNILDLQKKDRKKLLFS